MSTMSALLKREYIEHRTAILSFPIVITFIYVLFMVLSYLFGYKALFLSKGVTYQEILSVTVLQKIILATVLFPFVIGLILAIANYSLRCLYDDRRNNSILFWKSMPFSEGTGILAKVIMILCIMPFVFWIACVVTQIVALLFGTWSLSYLDLHIYDGSTLWNAHIWVIWGNIFINLYIQSLWTLPIVTWLMLCSSLAKRNPFFIAILIPIIICVIEYSTLGDSYVFNELAFIFNHLWESWISIFKVNATYQGMSAHMSFTPTFQTSLHNLKELWSYRMLFGLILSALFFWASTSLRNWAYER